MSNVPTDRRYTAEHEWAQKDGVDIVIGVTDHAQSALGDVVFLELPEAGRSMSAGKTFGVVESVKAVSDLFAPLDAEVLAVNDALVAAPDAINKDCYGAGWMLRVKAKNPADFDKLLDAAAYQSLLSQIAK